MLTANFAFRLWRALRPSIPCAIAISLIVLLIAQILVSTFCRLDYLWAVNLVAVNAICASHGIPLILHYGALIGIMRNKALLEWDYDIDIYGFRSELAKSKKSTIALKTQQQKVHEVHAKLSEAGVAHEDFLSLSETDLRSGLQACSINPFFIGRIISSLKKTEGSTIYNESKNTKFIKIYVTPQETQAFETLSNVFKTTSNAVARIQGTITKLEANRQSTLKSVDAAFRVLHEDLDRRKSALDHKINDVAQKKKNVLNQQLENLTKYRTSLQTAKRGYHQTLEDQQLNDHDRSEKNLRDIDQAINNEMKYDVTDPIVSAGIAFGYDSQYKGIADRISEFGNVSGSMKPPEILVTKTRSDRCTLSVRPHSDSSGSRLTFVKNEVQYGPTRVGGHDEKENGIRDDEKEPSNTGDGIKVVEIGSADGEVVISGLTAETKYGFRVRACYEQFGFTDYSDEVTIDTLKKYRPLKWDRNRHGKNLVFVNDQRVRYSTTQCIALADYVVKKEEHDTFEWTVQVHQYSNASHIGFIDASGLSSMNLNTHLGTDSSRHCRVPASAGRTALMAYGNHKAESANRNVAALGTGDVYKFVVDFRQNEVTLHLNGQSLGVHWQNVYAALIPAASNNLASAEYTISGSVPQ